MRTLCLSLVFLFGALFSKHRYNSQIAPVTTVDSVLIKLENKKAVVDQYITKHKKALIVLVKVPGKQKLVRVKNGQWPDEIECTYNILKSPIGKIIFIAEIPYSESGDWNIEYKHYFDEQGKTYAFTKEESIFDDNVSGGIVRESLWRYYDDNFKNIGESNGLLDKDRKAIKKNKSNFDFRNYKYNVYKNLSKCLIGYNIELIN